MGHVKELLGNAVNIGEVYTDDDDYRAQRTFRAASHRPVRSVRISTMHEPSAAIGIDAEASRLVPSLARLMVCHQFDFIVSHGQLSPHRRHRVAGRAVMRAAMQAATEMDRNISVLVAHGSEATQGSWTMEDTSESTAAAPGAATSYTRHLIRPGVLAAGESAIAHFVSPTEE